LIENTNRDKPKKSYESGIIFVAKLDYAEAKTNSESGVNNIYRIRRVLQKYLKIYL
jgi:dihydroorotase